MSHLSKDGLLLPHWSRISGTLLVMLASPGRSDRPEQLHHAEDYETGSLDRFTGHATDCCWSRYRDEEWMVCCVHGPHHGT